ncbi:MAG: alpha/beta hydrolase [Sterolibacteriaceae bacterium]|nr:alpha/beta hydrolase [Candidatus Methylophosphatis haderslevensis]
MVALVLLPGLDGTGLLFADFAASFGPEVKVIVASYPTDIPLDYSELEPIARSFLPRDQPFFLLAESFSGPIGISICASAPPGLLGLVLCCSFARNPVPAFASLRALVGIVPLSVMPVRLLGLFLLGRFASSARLGALARALALVSASVLRARTRAVLAVDVSASLPLLRVPVLYLRASEDRVVARSSSELVAALARQCKVAEFVAPHFLLQVSPSPVAARVTEFMCDRSGHE